MDQTITTSLVHQPDRGQASWWQTTVVCDLPGVYDDASLRAATQVLGPLAEVGIQTVLICPAQLLDEHSSCLASFISAAHEVGLRVIVRIFLARGNHALHADEVPPPLLAGENVDKVTTRIRAALEAGADGIDLGRFDIGALSVEDIPTELLDEVVNSALSELADFEDGEDLLLSAALPDAPRGDFVKNLEEHWFHHLSSAALLEVGWDASQIREAISEAYRARDPLGLTVPWRYLLQPREADAHAGGALHGWALGAPERRYDAMSLLSSALPGSVYLPFAQVGGAAAWPDHEENSLQLRFADDPKSEDRAETMRTALSVRQDELLGRAPLAFIDGLPWSEGALVLLCGPIMVVLNTSQNRVVVPREHCLVAASGEVRAVVGGATAVPADTCCWFRPADVVPADPGKFRR